MYYILPPNMSGDPTGPWTKEQIQKYLLTGMLSAQCLCAKDGDIQWIPISRIFAEELQPSLSSPNLPHPPITRTAPKPIIVNAPAQVAFHHVNDETSQKSDLLRITDKQFKSLGNYSSTIKIFSIGGVIILPISFTINILSIISIENLNIPIVLLFFSTYIPCAITLAIGLIRPARGAWAWPTVSILSFVISFTVGAITETSPPMLIWITIASIIYGIKTILADGGFKKSFYIYAWGKNWHETLNSEATRRGLKLTWKGTKEK